ncbi:unnamed protein product [Brassica rapa]|uniref:Uncharacterized protein n=1 Tax=Brassica campestris TaxID=3711 RepID=A0A8D9M161_BRACM|nr:unnamed protein product [Brassica rapa]
MALRSKRLATLILSISNNSQVCNSGGIASIGTSFSRRISSATSSAAVVVDDESRAYVILYALYNVIKKTIRVHLPLSFFEWGLSMERPEETPVLPMSLVGLEEETAALPFAFFELGSPILRPGETPLLPIVDSL